MKKLLALLCLLVFTGSGCNNKQSQDVKAIGGIAFLIIEANYSYPENKNAIKDGVKYSKYWLSKQPSDKKNKLEELSYLLSSLIIDLNIKYLEEMTGRVENIAGKLDEKSRLKFEKRINEEEGFGIEWKKHKDELNKEMLKSIDEFRKELGKTQQKEQIIAITREVYTKSQPELRQSMQNRIKEIFSK